jgi:diguanylate cyclase (GGDEF)-like protein
VNFLTVDLVARQAAGAAILRAIGTGAARLKKPPRAPKTEPGGALGSSSPLPMYARIVRLLFVALALLAAAGAHADEVLRLDPARSPADAWPYLQVLSDPSHALTLAEVQRARFAAPEARANNFGPRTEALWLRVAVQPTGGAGRWVLEVDYPALNRIDAYLVRDGQLVQQVAMGSTLPAADRPLRTRSHAAVLDLAPDQRHELYLRVQSTTTLVVPVRLHSGDAFVAHESGRLLLQGLMFGVTLTLLVFSVVNGVSLRDPVFAPYALMLIGVSMFFVSFGGLGHQFLWDVQTGWLAQISPWGALLAIAGAGLFVVGALEMHRRRPRAALALRATAAAAAAAIAGSMLGLLDYRLTSLAATVLGPVLLALALVESLRQALAGSRIALYMALGWGAYAVGALSMAALLRGWLDVNFWTLHLFQFASIAEMFCWMRVLALRIEGVRRDAEHAAAEKKVLHSLAHTDALTGLPNRRGLAAALDAALPAASAERALALFLIDLDGFKAVNDRLGHDAGDALLVQVAERLRGVLRSTDAVARHGGDEFVVMSQGVPGEPAALAIGQKMLEAFRAPFVVAGEPCRVGATIGLALAPHDGRRALELLRHADAAMYAGKQQGRHCVRRRPAAAALAV